MKSCEFDGVSGSKETCLQPRNITSVHQEFQVPKMEVLNLIRLCWGWVFPYISRIHTAYIGENLHFRYLKCSVISGVRFDFCLPSSFWWANSITWWKISISPIGAFLRPSNVTSMGVNVNSGWFPYWNQALISRLLPFVSKGMILDVCFSTTHQHKYSSSCCFLWCLYLY